MLKKNICLIVLLFLGLNVSFALNRQVINPTEISIKAGPTEPDEKVQLLWLESYVYPREIKKQGLVSLGVRGTSRVDAVKASFDFSKRQIDLTSTDNTNWSAVYELPENLSPGLHVVRYEITNQHEKIRRTVDFFVKEHVVADIELTQGEKMQNRSFPVTVVSTSPALVGDVTRMLHPGDEIIAVAKVPWYKVILADGAEGWVSATVVEEPLEEYYLRGYQSYQKKDYLIAIEYYKNCIAIDPNFFRGHYWLAKSYHNLGDLDAAYLSLLNAIKLDERNIESKIFANVLAQDFYKRAKEQYTQGRFNEAVVAYQRVLDLKPTSMTSWIELGYSYQKLALYNEAKTAWKAALKYDQNNEQLLALLGVEEPPIMVAAVNSPKPQVPAKTAGLPAAVVDDSLEIVRLAKTERGTKIETALKSVVSLTKSLGTPVVEKGWQTVKQGDKYLVRYLCEQGVGVVEAFEWLVDIDTKKLSASNDNARLLMNRW